MTQRSALRSSLTTTGVCPADFAPLPQSATTSAPAGCEITGISCDLPCAIDAHELRRNSDGKNVSASSAFIGGPPFRARSFRIERAAFEQNFLIVSRQ